MNKKEIAKYYILPVVMLILIAVVWNYSLLLKKSGSIISRMMANKIPYKKNPVLENGVTALSINDEINDIDGSLLKKNFLSESGVLIG